MTKCPACNGTGKVTVEEIKTPGAFPAKDRKHIRGKRKEIVCPVCYGKGKVE